MTARVLPVQKTNSALHTSAHDQNARKKEAMLQCLTRLNDKATLRVAAEELSSIIRALDQESLAALVQSICNQGAWEPKPLAKKEYIRALGQLPLHSCPVADIVLQQYLPRILGHLRKNLQDSDSLVRDAASEALAAYACALTEATGSLLPGSTQSPVVKVIFDCLAEQKKEGQHGASHALLLVAPCLEPLDRDLVRLILKLLKSGTFQGTAALLAAIASTDLQTHAPDGLLKAGASAFLPYLTHLVGQLAPRCSQDGGTAANSTGGGGGILGCLASKDWAVRRAAADAIRALVLLLGPALEPESCWELGDPGSLTHRCLHAMDASKFDKVKEAREAIRDAAALVHELHQFIQEVGPAGDWHAWISSRLPYAACMSTCASAPPSPQGVLTAKEGDGKRPGSPLRHSPISERFHQAAVQGDLVAEPGSNRQVLTISHGDSIDQDAAAAANATEGDVDQFSCGAAAAAVAGSGLPAHMSDARTGDSAVQGEPHGASPQQIQQPPQQLPTRELSKADSAACDSASRGSSRPSSRPTSQPTSRRGTAEQQAAVKRQSSRTARPPAARQSSTLTSQGSDTGYLDSTVPAERGISGQQSSSRGHGAANSAQPLPHSRPNSSGGRRPRGLLNSAGGVADPQAAWVGPTQQEWQQVQEQLARQQELHVELVNTVQQLQLGTSSTIAGLQDRANQLEQQQEALSQQLALLQQQQQKQQQPQLRCSEAHPPSSPGQTAAPGPASKIGPSRSMSAKSAPGSATATPSGSLIAAVRLTSARQLPVAVDDRLSKSEEWGTPNSMPRRSFGSPLQESLSGGRQSHSSFFTTPSSRGDRSFETHMSTPGDLDAAYSDALRGDKGDVHLLRLIQKTGPVWDQLSQRTCQDLLAVFLHNVQDGVMLHRVLPWLWRLADESVSRPDVPWELQQQLLEALQCCPVAEDLQGREKVSLLSETLKAVWMRAS